MIQRIPRLSDRNSFFLFGARGTGKSTLIEKKYHSKKTLWVDLLLYEEEEKFSQNPDELLFILNKKKYKTVVIDEIQKVPKLLDVIQKIMREKPGIQFIMTGSSARKLKRGSGNLLAGRAFQYYLFPFSIFELNEEVDFHHILKFGTLPEIFQKKSPSDKKDFLKSYVQTYLKEEIISEQIIRKLNPFRNFLQVAAQQSGQIINYSNISQDIGVDDKTVKNYFSILEDTLLGFFLPHYHRSVRKQQRQAPKFYFFDTGVKRALDKQLESPLIKNTYSYGNAFEHRVLLECFYLNECFKKDFSFYYLMTKDQNEVDLIIERPGKIDIIVEIKSTQQIQKRHINKLCRFQKNWPQRCKAQAWSQEKVSKMIEKVECLFWQDALRALFF
ncbi:MAG: AAA family ATPase [Bdellovibrionales bacterium]|nr:AAA family ATPase [Bdellovibrionales bacterium]